MTRSKKGHRSQFLATYAVHPDDVEMLPAQHTAYDPHYTNRVPEDGENDEGGWMETGLQRWHDRDFKFAR